MFSFVWPAPANHSSQNWEQCLKQHLLIWGQEIQGQSRQTVNFDFDLMGTYYKIVLGIISYKWALVMDISLSEAKMLKYQS